MIRRLTPVIAPAHNGRRGYFAGRRCPMHGLKSTSPSGKQGRRRLFLEQLETRLAPGDTLLGALVGWSLLDCNELRFADDLSFRSDDSSFLNIHRPKVAGAERSEAPDKAPTTSRVHRGVEDSAPATSPPLDQRAAGLTPAERHFGANSHARHTNTDARAMLSRPNVDGVAPEMVGREGMGVAPASMLSRPTPFTKIDPVAAGRDSMAPASISGEPSDKFGALPFYFEQNVGQAAEGLDFVARAPGYTLGLSATEAVFALPDNVGCVKSSQTHHAIDTPVRLRGLDAPYDCHSDTQHSKLSTQHSLVRMQLVGGNPAAPVTGVDPLVTKVNYFLGNDPNEWHTNISTFGKVQYDNVYPGIDLVYYGNGGNLEYDFVVSPGADPDVIALSFEGADDIEIAADGALVVRAGAAEIRQPEPYIYQEVDGTRQQVAGSFSLSTQHSTLCTPASAAYCLLTTVYFDAGSYDRTRPLVIDPLVLGYSTYLGAGGAIDVAYGIAAGDSGHAYVVGETRSVKFPATDGAFDETYNEGTFDAFVGKLNEDGSALVYATYLGGTGPDTGRDIGVDSAGHAYVTGSTWSSDFPATSGAFDPTHNSNHTYADVFVTKMSPDGSGLVYSSFVGGRNTDFGNAIAVDVNGSAYVTGSTDSSNFPVTPGALDMSYNGGLQDTFVAKLDPAGGALAYASYLGGSDNDVGSGIAVSTVGDAFLTGFTRSLDFPTTPSAFDESHNGGGANAFITKLTPNGSSLAYSTYLAGSDGAGGDDIAVDSNGNAYVVGTTSSEDFPVTPGAYDTFKAVIDGSDGFLTKFNSTGSALVYSTYLSAGSDSGNALALDTELNAYVTGTAGVGLDTTPDSFDKTYNGGSDDAYIMKLNAVGSALVYSSYIGGTNSDHGWDMAVDENGNAIVAGDTFSGNYPTTPDAFKRRNRENTVDGFVTKFTEA
jgi:hypothetical protein